MLKLRKTLRNTDTVLEGLQLLSPHQEPCLGRADVAKECMNGIWKKTLKSFGHDSKRFNKDEKFAKISKAVVEMANKFNLV